MGAGLGAQHPRCVRWSECGYILVGFGVYVVAPIPGLSLHWAGGGPGACQCVYEAVGVNYILCTVFL